MRVKLIIFLAIIMAIGCRKDDVNTDTDLWMPPTIIVDHVNAKVAGVVTDMDGNSIDNALVKWGDANTMTDENGVFIVESTVKERNAPLTVTKDGFFDAIQSLHTFSEGIIRIKVQLIARTLTTSIQSDEGGEVQTADGGIINFAANSFKDLAGNPYSGTVNVYAYYLNPTIADLQQIMPGNLQAVDAQNTPQLLKSFGMMNIELEDDNGNLLQISETAVLTTPIPASLRNAAPETIPLWYFDESEGIWREEGHATLQGDEYVGDVTHFTWWNCDVPANFVYLEGEVTAGATASPVFEIKITVIENGTYGTMFTTDKSLFGGFVPKDEPLLLEVFNICGEVIYSDEIGAFSEDTQLPIINIEGEVDWYTFEGNLVDCELNSVSNGYVSVNLSNYNGGYLFTDELGDFQAVFPDCGDTEMTYYGVDMVNELGSTPVTIPFTDDISTGTMVACDELEGQISITINGVTEVWSPCTMSILGGQSVRFYVVSFLRSYPDGIVEHTFKFRNSTDSPTEWDNFYEFFDYVQGSQEPYSFRFNKEGTILENSEIPGTIFHLIDTVFASYGPTMSIDSQSIIEIKAIIQE